jgi:phospholipid/cholesterol/gamma-HCH transport system substrate-binding protein
MRETDIRFAGLKKRAWLFFGVAIIGIVITVILIGIERDIFTAKFRLYFATDKGTGLFEGMPVKLSGFKIGKVENITLDENANVKAAMLIQNRYQKWIREDSVAVLGKEGFIGESVIDISAGSMTKPMKQNNSEINFERTKGLDQIMEDVRPILSEVKKVIDYMNDPNSDLKLTIHNLKELSSELRTTREKLDGLIKNADLTASSVGRKIDPLMNKLEKTMDNAEKTTTKLREAVDKSADKLPSVLNKADDALDDTSEITKSLKQMWPISLFIKEQKDNLIPGDSYE